MGLFPVASAALGKRSDAHPVTGSPGPAAPDSVRSEIRLRSAKPLLPAYRASQRTDLSHTAFTVAPYSIGSRSRNSAGAATRVAPFAMVEFVESRCPLPTAVTASRQPKAIRLGNEVQKSVQVGGFDRVDGELVRSAVSHVRLHPGAFFCMVWRSVLLKLVRSRRSVPIRRDEHGCAFRHAIMIVRHRRDTHFGFDEGAELPADRPKLPRYFGDCYGVRWSHLCSPQSQVNRCSTRGL